MRIQYTQETRSGNVIIADTLHVRAEATSAQLCFDMLKPMEQLPVLSLQTRVIGMLMAQSEAAGSDMLLAERALRLSGALRSIADWLRLGAQVDRVKLEQDVMAGGLSAATFAQSAGLTKYVAESVLSSTDIEALLSFARAGTGPAFSQRDAVAVFHSVASLAARPQPVIQKPGSEGDEFTLLQRPREVLNFAFMIRLAEYCRGLLGAPATVSPNVDTDPKNAMQQRIDAFIQLAATLAQLVVGSYATMHDHLSQFVLHKWVLAAAKGRLADDIARAVHEYESRAMHLPSFPVWPELATGTLFDVVVIGTWPPAPPDPTTQLLPNAPSFGVPLAGDLSMAVDFSPQSVMLYADALWNVKLLVEGAYDVYERASEGRSFPLALIPSAISAQQFSGGLTLLPRASKDLPVCPSRLPGFRWFSETENWALLSTPLSQWVMTTLANVEHDIRDTPSVQYAPTIIEGDDDLPVMRGLPVIIPFFSVFDEPAPAFLPSRESLLALWRRSATELDAWIDQLRSGINSPAAQGLADRLRFIGVLFVELNGTERPEPILPFDGGWYHTSRYSAFTDAKNAIELGTREVDLGRGRERITAKFILKPFTHVPSSALTLNMASSLRIVKPDAERLHKPLVVWEADDHIDPERLLPIKGWHVHPAEVRDIVLTPTLPAPATFRPIHVVPTADGEFPLYAHYFNQVISIDGASVAPEAGIRVPASRRFVIQKG